MKNILSPFVIGLSVAYIGLAAGGIIGFIMGMALALSIITYIYSVNDAEIKMKKQKSKLDIEQICWWIILVCGLIMAFILIYVVIFNPPATLQTLNQTENQTSDNFDYINFLEKVEKDCGSTFLVYRDDEWKVFGNKCLQSYPYYCSVQYTKLKDCLK